MQWLMRCLGSVGGPQQWHLLEEGSGTPVAPDPHDPREGRELFHKGPSPWRDISDEKLHIPYWLCDDDVEISASKLEEQSTQQIFLRSVHEAKDDTKLLQCDAAIATAWELMRSWGNMTLARREHKIFLMGARSFVVLSPFES